MQFIRRMPQRFYQSQAPRHPRSSMAILLNRATTTVKSTDSLDVETVRQLESLAMR